MKTVSLWFDGGGCHGIGNICRSLELGRRLARFGYEVSFRPLSSDAANLAGLAFGADVGKADVVVLDVPYFGDVWSKAANEGGARVLALDYEGAVAPDLVVSLQAVRALAPGTRHLVGLDYAIIRSEFLAPTTKGSHGEGFVLVMLGGGAPAEQTERILRQVAAVASNVVLVQGPLAAGIGLGAIPSCVRVVNQPENLAALMAGCSWAVTTGGASLMELVHLGRAVYVLPRTPAEATFVAIFAGHSVVFGIGEDSLDCPTAAQREHCAVVGPRLIDGRGCERLAELIDTLL
jgi:spore coat polysaccharide biosynthesis predicted glycosyltransferase SpsG